MSSTSPTKRPTAVKFVTTTQGVSLNIRSAPDPTAPMLSKLPRGSRVTIYIDGVSNGFAQLVDEVSGQVGYTAMQWLADSIPDTTTTPAKPTTSTSTVPATPPSPVTPTPMPSGPVVARPGMHIQGSAINHGLRDQLIVSARACHDAGHPYGAVVVCDDPWMANEMARYTTVVFRHVQLGGLFTLDQCQTPEAAKAHAASVYNAHRADMNAAPNVQFFQLHNEDGVNADFEMETMRLAEIDNRHVGLFGYSVGTPEVAQWQALAPVLRHAMANGHVAVLHEYGPFIDKKVSDQPVSSPTGFEWYGGRHRSFYAAMPADCQPRLIIGETGPSDSIFRGADKLIADQRSYIGLLRADPYVISACPFTFGPSWQDAAYELNSALADYEAFAKSM
jgi:hypothetical protein